MPLSALCHLGLLHNFKKGKWFLLRSTKVRTPCLLSEAWMYYAAIANNIVLRFFWVLKLSLVSSARPRFSLDGRCESRLAAPLSGECRGDASRLVEHFPNGERAGEQLR